MQEDSRIDLDVKEFEQILFPNGTNFDADQQKMLFDQYKIMVQSADQLAARRQSVNGFFLSLNTFMMAGLGFIFKESFDLFVHEHRVAHLMILALAVSAIGIFIDGNWSALLASYSRLIQSQVRVMESLEKYLTAALISAQMSSHRKELHSLSDLERNIAHTFQVIFALCGIGALVLMLSVYIWPTHK